MKESKDIFNVEDQEWWPELKEFSKKGQNIGEDIIYFINDYVELINSKKITTDIADLILSATCLPFFSLVLNMMNDILEKESREIYYKRLLNLIIEKENEN